MSRTVTIRSLPEAFAVIKEMEAEDCEWGEDYRAAGRAALVEILEGQMALRVDRHLDERLRKDSEMRFVESSCWYRSCPLIDVRSTPSSRRSWWCRQRSEGAE